MIALLIQFGHKICLNLDLFYTKLENKDELLA